MGKFQAIVWKNWKHLKQSPLVLLLLIVIPSSLMVLLLVFHKYTYYPPTEFKHETDIPSPEYFPFGYSVMGGVIAYAPKNNFTTEVMKDVKRTLKKTSQDKKELRKREDLDGTTPNTNNRDLRILAMNDENQLQVFYLKNISFDNDLGLLPVFWGIVFEKVGKVYQYKIRMANVIFEDSYTYFWSRFLTIQGALDLAIIRFTAPDSVDIWDWYSIKLCRFPIPSYTIKEGEHNNFLLYYTLMVVFIGFFIGLPNIIIGIVEEKATGVKELMKMMGMRNWMIWVGWLMYGVIINLIVTSLLTIFLTIKVFQNIPPLIPYVNLYFIWLLLFLGFNSILISLFVICASFHQPLIALTLSILIYFSPPILDIFSEQISSSNWSKLALCFLPTIALKKGIEIIMAFSYKVSVLDQLYRSEKKNDINLFSVIIILLIDMVLYWVFTWYMDKVRPGPFGRAKPWYFIFSVFSCKRKKLGIDIQIEEEDSDDMHFENPPLHSKIGISIRNLRKIYPPNVYALNGINLDIFKGQITVLLGHNGAGKTTTMSIIAGLFSPTSGTVQQHISETKYIDIFKNTDQFRKDLGVCPQHDLLFSYFTVIEHLIFFGLLKGMSRETARDKGLQLLHEFDIIDKKYKKPKKLSGGMKRKLQLSIALIASPTVLLLDEPTTGMDPESSRKVWDILLGTRDDRIIIMTTHSMEEADVLGDRIAIMENGKIYCCGTTMFLKKVYGTGYNMTLLTQPNADVNTITKIVSRYVPGSSLKTFHEGQIVYNLPSENSSKFSSLFTEIEGKKTELNISSIGLACTTIEDVFLKVGEMSKMKRNQDINDTINDSGENYSNRQSRDQIVSSSRITGLKLICRRFSLIMEKKMILTYRKKYSLLLFTIFALVLTAWLSNNKVSHSSTNLKLDLDLYKGSVVFVTYRNSTQSVRLKDIFKSLITDSKVNELLNKDITTELLRVGRDNIERYKNEFIIAANCFGYPVIGFYSSEPSHSAPVILNLITNSLLKFFKPDHSIVTFNHPMRPESEQICKFLKQSVLDNTLYGMPVVLIFPLLVFVASFIPFVQHENTTGAKHLQMMTGVSPLAYWLSVFIWDYSLFIVFSFLLCIPILIFDHLRLISNAYIAGVLLIIINLCGLSAISFAYFYSFFIKSSYRGPSYFMFLNLIFPIMLFFVFTLLPEEKIIILISNILLINPFYCVLKALNTFYSMIFNSKICKECELNEKEKLLYSLQSGTCYGIESYFANAEKHGIRLYLIMFFVGFIFHFLMILIIDYGFIKKISNCCKSFLVKASPNENLDSDVQHELMNVLAIRMNLNTISNLPVLTIDCLKQTYNRNFHAVKGISFTVSTGECFGLLGVNGAGKTTTFKMLTGIDSPTSGNAFIKRYSLLKNRYQYLSQVGYCPQYDAINEMTTGREALNLFAQLRGIRQKDAHQLTNYWLKLLGLRDYSDRLFRTLSGGNKRKVSAAVALIGDPVIAFLDEPTSSVDPISRRKLWAVLMHCQKRGQSFVISSHSMDECEALCNRLTIMVKGQLVCIGSVEYLKQKFGQGFVVLVKLNAVDEIDRLNQLKEEIETTFSPNCVLKEEHMGKLNYLVTDTRKTWSMLFQSMEKIKRKYIFVEDYTISETTLEQVFISFAEEQKMSV